jgi:glycosyltransferase involved in cell wall biosynthesis
MHSSLAQQLTNFGFSKSRFLIGLFERLEKDSLAHSDAVITICPELAEYVTAQFRDPERHFLIENSLFDDVRLKNADRAAESGPPVDMPADRPVILYAGTFERYQGLDILLRAFAEVRKGRPDAVLVLVGGTPDQVQEMRRLADGCGLNGECVFTGRVSPPAARRYAEKATVLVSPRSEGTNTPLKIYQILAGQVPLVATRIRSHTQVLDDQVCFLVDPEPRSMAQGILKAIDDAAARAQVIEQAQALYERAYSPSAYRRKIQRLLGTLTPGPRRKSQAAEAAGTELGLSSREVEYA